MVVVRVDSGTHTYSFYGIPVPLQLECLFEAHYLLLADLLDFDEFGLELVDLEGVIIGFGFLLILVILKVFAELVGWRRFMKMGMGLVVVVDLVRLQRRIFVFFFLGVSHK